MKLSDLYLNRYLYRDNNQSAETQGAAFMSADSSDSEAVPIPAGGAAQDINTGNTLINGEVIEPGTLPETVFDVSNWGWGQTCEFTSASATTVTWGAGTFTSADGNSYSISAGTTGAMAAKTYIYLSLLDSETEYQITTTPADAVGIGKVLIAVAENAADSATYMLSEAIQIVGDNIIANTINASKIVTGSITTTQLNFTPLYSSDGTGSIVATINASAEGINIAASKINISGDTTFSASYDPSTKVPSGGAADDINSNTTTISGGKIRTGEIESTGYSYVSGNYSAAGMQIDLDNGVVRSPNFAIDSLGNVYVNGDVTITNPGDIDQTSLANSAAAGATVGATWGTNLSSIPTRFGNSPGAAGLYVTASYLGYYSGAIWNAYIKSDGTFHFGNFTTGYVDWNGTTLNIKGTVSISNPGDIDQTTLNNAAAAGADVTQTALNAGANIDNAKANGTTLITGGYITTGIISASNINVGTLSASRIASGSLDASKITSNTITGTQITTSRLDTTSQYISGGLKVGGSGATMSTGVISASALLSAPKLRLAAGTSNPSNSGDIVNYASGGLDQFRGIPGDGTWAGSFDMTVY